MKCLILAAGLGTRLKPLTDTMPKALVTVNGKPLLAHVIERLKEAGATEIVVNVHHFGEQIIQYLDKHPFGLPIHISDERRALLDTGGGLRQAMSLFREDGAVLIHNVDIFSNADLRTFYEEHKEADAALLISRRKSTRALLFDERLCLAGWKNLTTGEVRSPYADFRENHYQSFAFSGIHLVSPRLLDELNTFPEKFSIMDFYLSVCNKIRIQGVPCENLSFLDVGKLDSIEEAGRFLQG